MHFDRVTYRHDLLGYNYGYRRHLFVVSARGGRPKQVTSGDWDVGDFAWGPCGKRLLVSGNVADSDRTYARDLYLVTISSGRIKSLCGLNGPISAPSVSPERKTVAFIGNDFRRGYASNSNVFVVPLAGGKPRNLTRKWDNSVGQTLNTDSRGDSPAFGLAWSPDGTEIKFLATVRGATHLFSASAETGHVATHTSGDCRVAGVS